MRILILDDHPIVRAGVGQIIRQRWRDAEVVELGSLAEATGLAPGPAFAAVVLDLSLPDASGLEGLIQLRRRLPDAPILILSMHAEEAYAIRALKMGAAGYLTKELAASELVAALERIMAGGQYITRSLAERLAGLLSGRVSDQPPHETLSAQEHRVLLLLAAGHSVGEVAQTMHLSAKTVSTYRARILEKMALTSNADLTRYCLDRGLI